MQPTTNAARVQPMICKQCGAEVPEGQLVCDCFKVEMDNELEQKGIEGFQNNRPLLLTKGFGHLLAPRAFMTLCHEKRYKAQPQGQDVYQATLQTVRSKICPKCLKALEAKLGPVT
jgi:hypothetical protein